MPSVQQIAVRTPIAFLLVAAGGWGMLAIWFQSPLPEDKRSMLAAAYIVAMCLAAGSVMLKSKRRFTVPLAYLAFLSVVSWWSSIRPAEYRDWSPEVARRSVISVAKEDIEVRNVRRFEWRSNWIARQTWETRAYRLSDLDNIDIIAARNESGPLAHSIASFGFSDGRRLALSVDARMERHEVFDWVAGLFRQYEMTLTAADEADIIREHAEALQQQVYRYRLDLRPEQVRRLFLKYAELARDLDREPRFYNSLTSHTTTAPFAMIRALNETPISRGVAGLFTIDSLQDLYASGLMAPAQSFDHAQALARIQNASYLTPEEPSLNLGRSQGWGFADAPRAQVPVR